jgi:hypothetical protein
VRKLFAAEIEFRKIGPLSMSPPNMLHVPPEISVQVKWLQPGVAEQMSTHSSDKL